MHNHSELPRYCNNCFAVPFIVETLFTALDENITKMEFYHYYETKSFKAKLLNSFIKWKIGKEAQATLFAIKKEIEQEAPY
ncbi:MAG: hypothetical protein WAM28_05025 [Chlamydiales bacterium]